MLQSDPIGGVARYSLREADSRLLNDSNFSFKNVLSPGDWESDFQNVVEITDKNRNKPPELL